MQTYAEQRDLLRSGRKLLSDRRSLLSRPPLQRNNVRKLQDELIYSLSKDISQIPSAIHSTMGHLTSRHMEVSQWQAHISQSISEVDQEMTAVLQARDVAEGVLQETQVYSQFLSDCMTIGGTLGPAGLRQDLFLIELNKEEHVIRDTRDLLQNQLFALMGNLSPLEKIRTQLQADFHDKVEAVELLTRCITWEVNTPCSHLPPAQCRSNHVSHDVWLSHSKNLKIRADKLIMESLSCRGILQFTLANIKNTQVHQRRRTENTLQRKIHKLSRVMEMLMWEKHQVKEDISDLAKEKEKLEVQIKNCESRLHQTNHRLDILNQRSRYELCMDYSHVSLTLEKRDLIKLVADFRLALNRSHQNTELALRRLAALEHKLVRNGQILEVVQRCQSHHQSFLPALNRAVVQVNKSRLLPLTSSSSTHQTHLQ